MNCKNVFATWAEVRYVLSKKFGRSVKGASLGPDEFVEEKYVFLRRNNGLQMFFGRWEEKCWTLARKINNIVRFAFLSVQTIFSKRKIFLEKNKHFANCFKFSTDFFVRWRTSTYFWQKIFSMLEKIRFRASAGFCHRKLSLFWWMIVFKMYFSVVGWMFSGRWLKTSTDCQNCIFICPEKHLQEKKISWKKTNSFINFQTSSGGFFKKIWWKYTTLAKIYQHSCHKWILHFQRDILGQKRFPKKDHLQKLFLYFEGNFSFFYRTCLACLSKTFHRLQMKVLRKVIFSNKKLFTEFFQNVERCRSLAMNLLRIVKNAFQLSRGTFREKFVFGKNIKCSITFFRIRETLFSSDLGENRAFGRKISAGLPKLDSTLPKCFIEENFVFWIDKCLETCVQTFGCFFSDSCNKQQKIVKLFFYLSRAIPPCEIYFPEK